MPPVINSSISLASLSRQLNESPGKTTVLLAVGVIFVGMLFRLVTGQSPATARGAVLAAGSSGVSPTVIITPGSSHKNLDGGMSLQQWSRQPIVPIHRDLFAISYDYYPRDGTPMEEQESGTGFWDRMAKSLSERADHIQQRQILVDNVRIAAGSLKLNSTLLGAVPEAVINGEMVREGGVVDDFRILRIEARRIVVEREGVKLAVLMK